MSLTNRQIEAYSRQIILRDFSAASQERLLAASIEIHGHGIAGQTDKPFDVISTGIFRQPEYDNITAIGVADLPDLLVQNRNNTVRLFRPSHQSLIYDHNG